MFTYDECEQIQAVIEILDGAQRTNTPYVQLRSEDAENAEKLLQCLLDKMLEETE